MYHFSTTKLPFKDQFEAWALELNPFFDMEPISDSCSNYNSQIDILPVGDMLLAGRNWLGQPKEAAHWMRRTTKKINSDALDGYYLQYQVTETMIGSSNSKPIYGGRGDLCFFDMQTPFDLKIIDGDSMCMYFPREMVPAEVASLHGSVLKSAKYDLLVDYMKSVFLRRNALSSVDILHIAEATKNLLRACLSPTAETVNQARKEIDLLLVRKIRRYVCEHLFDPRLSTEGICKDLGLSRSTLYRVLEGDGGIVRLIRARRLRHAHHLLATTARAHQTGLARLADQLGFASERQFARAFKKQYGYSPRDLSGLSRGTDPVRTSHASGDADNHELGRWLKSFSMGKL